MIAEIVWFLLDTTEGIRDWITSKFLEIPHSVK
jgi:hypothetical protein